MASTVQPLRVCLRAYRRAPVPQLPQQSRAAAAAAAAPRIRLQTPTATTRRGFSTTQPHPAKAKKPKLDEEDADGEVKIDRPLTEEELKWIDGIKAKWDKLPPAAQNQFEKDAYELNQARRSAMAMDKDALRGAKFWSHLEEDTEFITDEQNEDPFDEDDIMAMAHHKFEEFREYREYARLAAWEMPLLSKLARPFEPPTEEEPLRFRYTSYMGEFHPAESKVVVEFCPKDLGLTEAQQLKMKKLLGPRYNPETEIAKMSCEQFEHQAQNKRYLGDVINSLIEKAKDPTDMFEDIPLYTGHHTFKVKPKFPKEWRMTEERRKYIDEVREKALLIDKEKEEQGLLVDGPARIKQYLEKPVAVPEHVLQRPVRPTSRPARRI
ncbi:37S ribosomal protein S24, mitochondrial [Diatrype stigma]|uniref:37S ribosomal protein S24, mitochondrial n=1 Tax=Diatrype stigma TaxID=117547 RepID=A0AAN9UVF8_9PEZI